MAVAIAIATSMAFLTPISHPVNILMMGPGGYTPSDFFKVGVGMTLITFLTLIAALVLLWGIR
jgi:di/tricarboxylate transporter